MFSWLVVPLPAFLNALPGLGPAGPGVVATVGDTLRHGIYCCLSCIEIAILAGRNARLLARDGYLAKVLDITLVDALLLVLL